MERIKGKIYVYTKWLHLFIFDPFLFMFSHNMSFLHEQDIYMFKFWDSKDKTKN